MMKRNRDKEEAYIMNERGRMWVCPCMFGEYWLRFKLKEKKWNTYMYKQSGRLCILWKKKGRCYLWNEMKNR